MNKVQKFERALSSSFDDPSDGKPTSKRAKRLDYVRIPGVVSLSYSRLLTLNSCPRKFQLRELKDARVGFRSSIHTAFGSAYGAGVQEIWRTGCLDRALVAAFAAWDYDYFESDNKYIRGKSFWECCVNIEQYFTNIYPQLSEDWELAYVDGKPGIELKFYIWVGEKHNYQGHIDLLLQHKETRGLAVKEIKTSSGAQQEAQWGNSDQTNGYYTVMYAIQEKFGVEVVPRVFYHTLQASKWDKPDEDFGIKLFPYEKTDNQRAEFLSSVLSSVQVIQLYQNNGYFPKRGNSCVAFGTVCEFYGVCDLDGLDDIIPTEGGGNYEHIGIEDMDIVLDIADMVES